MLSDRSISIATRYWAAHLGCPPHDLFGESCRIITHGFELVDYPGAFALFRGATAIVSIPSDLAEPLRVLLSPLSGGCTSATFASALSAVSALVIGPAYIGYAETIAPPMHPARTLGSGDAAALQALRESCSSTEWEHGGSPLEHPCSGVFVDGQLVALAGYEIWGGAIAHVSVVTRPDFRGRGLGRSAVGHVAQRALSAGLLPQYRTLEANRASIRISETLDFHRFATSMAVRLRPEAALS
jgi:GNAT superfamily N-acetyltransferase